jgi:hypothetical protein
MSPEDLGAVPHGGPAAPKGSAAGDATLLGPWIDRLVDSGLPVGGNAPPRAVIAPHVDPARGGRIYGSAYRLLRGHPARRIVILGIGHAGGGPPFAMTERPIETPFGACAVDEDLVRSLARDLPFDPLVAETFHRREHSIRHQALFLRRVLDGWDRRRLVPIYCAFTWTPRAAEEGASGRAGPIEAFTRSLAGALDDETLVIAGVDLAHVASRAEESASDAGRLRRETERLDRELLERVVEGDSVGFRGIVDREGNARAICGYPALTTLMEILPGACGILVDYGQSFDRSGGTLVTFGAALLR